MRVPISWLKDYVAVEGDAAALAKQLAMAGVGVEAIEGDVLVLEITTNRADLLALLGVAREVGLIRRTAAKEPAFKLADGGPAIDAKVQVDDAAGCPRYVARVIRGVKAGPSPAWMQQKLIAALGDAFKPVNVIADVTNYVMLEYGQPLHAFDLKQVRGKQIIVRRAKPGEKMAAINGKDYALQNDLVIADAERPVAIAGVMGGKESEITAATTDVLLESAMFEIGTVRRTSRRLGLSSESSYRFERGVDWDAVDRASERAAQMIAELAGGTVAKGAVDVSVPRVRKIPFTLRFEKVRDLLGVYIEDDRVIEILRGLGADVKPAREGSIEITAPPTRRDLAVDVDMIEEVARIEGYDKIPTDVTFDQMVPRDNPVDLVRDEVRSTLTGLGAFEVLTWSFEDATAAPVVTFWSAGKLLPLRNPHGNVDRTLRNSLGPALLKVLRTNEGCGETLHPIYEIAHAYIEPPDGDTPGEKTVLGIAQPGGVAAVRAMVRTLFERLQIPFASEPLAASWLGAGETIKIGPANAGYLGRIDRHGVAEIDFDVLAASARLIRKAQAFSIHSAVRRDLAMVYPADVRWPAIEAKVRSLSIPTLSEVAFLNHFEDKKLGEGKRSIALSLTFLAPDRTLTGQDVDATVKSIQAALQASFGATPR